MSTLSSLAALPLEDTGHAAEKGVLRAPSDSLHSHKSAPMDPQGGSNGSGPFSERREHPRSQLALDVRLDAPSGVSMGRSRDLSLTGLSLETSAPLRLGDEVTLTLDIPGCRLSLILLASVRWVAGDKVVGLQFMSPRPQTVWTLQRFLAQAR